MDNKTAYQLGMWSVDFDLSKKYSIEDHPQINLQELELSYLRGVNDAAIEHSRFFDDKDWNDQVNCFFQFMMDNFETELVIMGTKIALATYKLPLDVDQIKCFMEFHKKYGKYIAAATDN